MTESSSKKKTESSTAMFSEEDGTMYVTAKQFYLSELMSSTRPSSGGGGGVGVGGGCEGDEGMSSGEGGEISVEIIQLINTLGNIRIREAGVSSSSSAHHNTSSGGKKKKKKKRGNKPMVVDTGLTVDPATVPVSAVDTETVVMSTSSADNDHNIARKVGPQKGGVVNDGCRTIKDIVRQEQMSKPLRVHEYYKLWGIYELDVVY